VSGFVVKYKVRGEERMTEEYASRELAQTHADDIRGYEGVQYAVVEPAPPPCGPNCGHDHLPFG
jgi:hypothetical protein